MAITFDTLDEFKAFYQAFHLSDVSPMKSKQPELSAVEIPITKEKVKNKAQTKVENEEIFPVEESVLTRRQSKSKNPVPKKMSVKTKTKRVDGKSMTALIGESIQKHLKKARPFTANDIYAILVKQDESVNKQSVITSVLKQMNTTFSHVSVKEHPGKGPRPVKLYNS